MKFITNLNFFRHLVAWLVYFLINFYSDIFLQDFSIEAFVFIFFYFLLTIITFYLFYFFIAPRFLKSKFIWFIPLFFILVLVFRFFIQEYVIYWFLNFENHKTYASVLDFIESNFINDFVPALGGSLLFLFEKSKRTEANALKLMNEKNESELSFLRSQINPHFLFNTLNFLYTKAFKTNEELANSILKLADVLRYTLKNSETGKVAIAEEIKLINDIIDLFKARFGEKCYVEFSLNGNDFSQQFEPLLLMPFVENAFKHGVYTQSENPIKFILNVEKGSLFFSVSNRVKHQHKDEVSGIGISNLKRRLALMYPKKHELSIYNSKTDYKATLKISL